MGEQSPEETVQPGNYVVIEKQNFRKLCKITEKGTFTLGKEQVQMEDLVNKPYWTTFKMFPSKISKKHVSLEVALKAETMEDIRQGMSSGTDNRSITDDGTSQKLSKEEIEDLRDAGKSSKEIVTSLISNSTSFATKTEFSQEKYIKKKEKKYCRYLTMKKPSISMIQEIYFRQDSSKINFLRMDTLSQILSYSDVRSEGKFLLYDSGTSGLSAAALLNRIGAGTSGSLTYLYPGNQAQLMLVQAMNYPEEQLKRMMVANLFTFLRIYHQGEDQIMRELVKKHCHWKKTREMQTPEEIIPAKKLKLDKMEENGVSTEKVDKNDENNEETMERVLNGVCSVPEGFKEPKWFRETKNAVSCFKEGKADGLIIVTKEHPFSIVKSLLSFLGMSRPFIIYHCHREPLQETYVALKQRKDIVNLRLFSNFFRGYQVLPNRTHPEIMMNDLGGYLLTGFLVE
ncbi:tRNA (adenine(58)-N(1))-methyltransferase non-catalytic subunit TRM6 [Fopius arisanus]|uniref:tRNA (adenine(58)-N(1))-methyltransferase non-catalytic subunit TRM6 n=1 Tax=Fopius arisanus TaxID=64838 RepID=A0A9R1T274_9HYME|nr:PREDICTED: tRNA (adenine(58)-N(1))-methyltransferase non-catalytic subunit TRM6 [Fopius arisanus]XP_011301517.1 PREDICTED: tRNA (adenine(58)-N(1))-methyltransferase non-catalytic subunit TRM6 [Fopius arisanus]